MLLDTNYVIALFAGDKAAVDLAAETQAYFLPTVVIGELCYVARNSTRVEKNLAKIAELQLATTVLPCDESTAKNLRAHQTRASASRQADTRERHLDRRTCGVACTPASDAGQSFRSDR